MKQYVNIAKNPHQLAGTIKSNSYFCTENTPESLFFVMSVAEILSRTDKTLFSFEVLPPLRGKNMDQLYTTIDRLMKFDPAFIEVTTHRTDFTYREVEPGKVQRVEERLRPGTAAVAYAIKQRYGVPVVPHLICSGNTRQETEYELIDFVFLGMFDLLVLRGDKSKLDDHFIPKDGGLSYASELCAQVNDFNAGKLLYGDTHDMLMDRCFTYGVAGYPEKHAEAVSADEDMEVLKRKVDLGARYIVTQMFFDNSKYFADVGRCRAAGIDVPVVPGLKPLGTLNQLTLLPKVFHIEFPKELAAKLAKCTSNDDVKKVGVEWGIRQCSELRAAGVPSLHFYTMNASSSIEAIMNNL